MRPIIGKRTSRINLEPAKANSYVILKPFVYETASTGFSISIVVGEIWKQVSKIYVNVSNTWREATNLFVNVSNTWK